MGERTNADKKPESGAQKSDSTTPETAQPDAFLLLQQPGVLMQLQRTIGNRAVQRLMNGQPARTGVPGMIQRQSAPAAEEDSPLQVETYSPTPGITVHHNGQKIDIIAAIEVVGADATDAMAATMQQTIHDFWNRTFPDGNTITCQVTVTVGTGDSAASGKAQIRVGHNRKRASYVATAGENDMVLNLDRDGALTWVVAHEFGHMLGLADRYDEGVISGIKALIGLGNRKTSVQAGYETNIMGAGFMPLESQNINDLISENAAGNSERDDRVRAWVESHDAEILALPTATRIDMLKTLLKGWISEADIKAIRTICNNSPMGDAPAIRDVLEPLMNAMTDSGQRSRVRAILNNMDKLPAE